MAERTDWTAVSTANRRAAGVTTVERIAPSAWERIADWDEVISHSAAPSVFLIRDWISAWWGSFGAGREPCLLRVSREGGATLAIAPFYVERMRSGMRRLGLLGDRVVGSEYLGLAARKGSEAAAARAVADWLMVEGPRWQLAELSGLRQRDPAAVELERALGAQAARTAEVEQGCSAIALPTDFEQYLSGLNAKFRRTYRQRTNKLFRSCDARFLMTESEADLAAHLEVLFRLHQARWIETGRPGVFADPRMRSFYHEVSGRLLRSGRLRFWHLEVDGAIRASQFGFAHAGTLHSLQEAYDSEFRKPGVGGLGVVLRGHVLSAAIEEGLRAYDFLGGVEEHKLRWGASVHTVRDVRLGRGGAGGRVAWLESVGAPSAREAVKSRLPERTLDWMRGARAAYHRRRGRRA